MENIFEETYLETLEDEVIEAMKDFYMCDDTVLLAYFNRGDIVVWYGCRDMADVAYEYVHELYVWDELVYDYFDYEKLGRDIAIEGYFLEDGNGNMVELR